jgi:photosystem II stability/assembly factor-like uncharacterized protein
MKPNKTLLLILSLFLLSACVEIPEIIQDPATLAAPSATPRIIQATPSLATSETATQVTAPSETAAPAAARAAEPAPQLIQIAMFDQQNGWSRSEEVLFHTTDGGQSWQIVQIPIPENQAYFNVTYFDATTAYVISTDLGATPKLLHITRDSGQTWQKIELANLNPGSASVVAVTPEILFLFEDLGAGAGSQGVALSRSLDGGQTWELNFAHVPGETSGASLPLGGIKSLPAFLDPELGFIGGSHPVDNEAYFFRTEDGGRSWQPQALPVPSAITGYMALNQTPLTFPGDSQNIIEPVSFSLTQGDPLLVFFSSSNRGQTWQASAGLAYGGAYHFLNPKTAWVWADGALYKTNDGGQTWQTLPDGLPEGASVNSLTFSDPQNGWALVFELDFETHLYITHDGGQTWLPPVP